jgi:hypothetical protein
VVAGIGRGLGRLVSNASLGFCDWAAQALLAALRAGEPPQRLTPADLNWAPMRERFRAALTPADTPIVESFLSDDHTVMWGAVMSRSITDESITVALLSAFRREGDTERKLGLLHHLAVRRLDAPDREELAAWCERQRAIVLADQMAQFGGATGEQQVRDRLSDPAYAEKRWFYMYSAQALDRPVARQILREHLEDEDALVATTAARSLAAMAPRVLLSYRRADNVHAIARLDDSLTAHLGAGSVVRDVVLLDGGDLFLDRLADEIRGCSALLVAIGPNWDSRRLWEPDDVVRFELSVAVQHHVPLLAVLIDGSSLPTAEALPPELHELLARHAVEVRHDPDFHRDVAHLAQVVDHFAGEALERTSTQAIADERLSDGEASGR